MSGWETLRRLDLQRERLSSDRQTLHEPLPILEILDHTLRTLPPQALGSSPLAIPTKSIPSARAVRRSQTPSPTETMLSKGPFPASALAIARRTISSRMAWSSEVTRGSPLTSRPAARSFKSAERSQAPVARATR